MSALHRLKAYFGMVPAEEFDAAQFGDPAQFGNPAQFNAAHFNAAEFGPVESDEYRSGHRSGYPVSNYGSASRNHPVYAHQKHDHDFGGTAASLPGERQYSAERPVTRRPFQAGFDDHDDGFPVPAGHHGIPGVYPARSSSSADPRKRPSRAAEPWGADASVRGSLAINIDTAAIDSAVAMNTATTDVTFNSSRNNSGPTPRQPIAPQPFAHESRIEVSADADDEVHPLSRIVTLHPRSYNEARPIGEHYREGNPVIMNLTAMEDRDAKRLVDFAAGLAFALRGSIDKVTNKVFLLSPPNVDVSAEDRRRLAEGRPLI
jgi:FtsZ-interacting cell division protein YlmF